MAGDVLAAIAAPFVSVPMLVAKGYAPPSFVGPGTLCFAVSYSGNTEETVEAAQAAAAAGARMVVVSEGGLLGKLAPSWQAPHVKLPDVVLPRAGLGALAVPLLSMVERVGLFPGASAWVDAAVTQLRARRDALVAGDSAQRIARSIGRTVPLVFGAGPLGAVAAQRWKAQVNENAKAPAFAATIPELCHNEICGWGQHGDVTRQVFTLVELRHGFEHEQLDKRFALTRTLIEEALAQVLEVRAEGEGRLAQLLDLMYVGDWASCYLALDHDVDPGPIDTIFQLKDALGQSV